MSFYLISGVESFHIADIVDIKDIQRYKYGDNLRCRCCEISNETLVHVLSECPALTCHPCSNGDEYSDDLHVLEKVVIRVQEFLDKVDAQENDEDNEDWTRWREEKNKELRTFPAVAYCIFTLCNCSVSVYFQNSRG